MKASWRFTERKVFIFEDLIEDKNCYTLLWQKQTTLCSLFSLILAIFILMPNAPFPACNFCSLGLRESILLQRLLEHPLNTLFQLFRNVQECPHLISWGCPDDTSQGHSNFRSLGTSQINLSSRLEVLMTFLKGHLKDVLRTLWVIFWMSVKLVLLFF